jgi:hypothetical protein
LMFSEVGDEPCLLLDLVQLNYHVSCREGSTPNRVISTSAKALIVFKGKFYGKAVS